MIPNLDHINPSNDDEEINDEEEESIDDIFPEIIFPGNESSYRGEVYF